MNVENAHGKLADEVAAENTHVARQADQTNIVVAKFGHKLAVVDLAVQTFRRQNHSVEATLESQGDAGSLGPVRDDDRDLCVEASGGAAARRSAEWATNLGRCARQVPWEGCGAYYR